MSQSQEQQIDAKIHSFLEGKSRDRLADRVAKWIMKPRGFRTSDTDRVFNYESLPWAK